MMPVAAANALGVTAIVAWGSLGLLGKLATSMPPLFVLAVCFGYFWHLYLVNFI